MPVFLILKSSEFQNFINLTNFEIFMPKNEQISFIFPQKTLLLNGWKLTKIFIFLSFFYQFWSSYYNIHSIFRIIAYQCLITCILTSTSMLSLIMAWIFEENPFFLQFALYFDYIINFFSILMLYPLIFNQLLSCMHPEIWRRVFNRVRILFLVSLCAFLASIAAVVLIQTSELRRIYIRRIGFVDTGYPGYQMLINRIFYIFPFGSIICYIVLYFHVRRMTQQVLTRRTSENGKQRVFVQLFITILFYGIICILFEIVNSQVRITEVMHKVDVVVILNIINYLPEISLPLMLLLSKTDMKRKITTIIAPRSNNVSFPLA